jgi:hypothetical protein
VNQVAAVVNQVAVEAPVPAVVNQVAVEAPVEAAVNPVAVAAPVAALVEAPPVVFTQEDAQQMRQLAQRLEASTRENSRQIMIGLDQCANLPVPVGILNKAFLEIAADLAAVQRLERMLASLIAQ